MTKVTTRFDLSQEIADLAEQIDPRDSIIVIAVDPDSDEPTGPYCVMDNAIISMVYNMPITDLVGVQTFTMPDHDYHDLVSTIEREFGTH